MPTAPNTKIILLGVGLKKYQYTIVDPKRAIGKRVPKKCLKTKKSLVGFKPQHSAQHAHLLPQHQHCPKTLAMYFTACCMVEFVLIQC